MPRSASKIFSDMMRTRNRELERLAELVMHDRDMRSEPNTALISEAAKRLIARRKFMETIKKKLVEHRRVPKEELSEAIEYVNDFFSE